jgi:hypothetical protein
VRVYSHLSLSSAKTNFSLKSSRPSLSFLLQQSCLSPRRWHNSPHTRLTPRRSCESNPDDHRCLTKLQCREETVEFNITFNKDQKTFPVLRLVLAVHVPSLAIFFRYPGVKSVTLTDVPVKSFDIFLGWLRFENIATRDDPGSPWPFGSPRTPDFGVMNDAGGDYYDSGDPIMWPRPGDNFMEIGEAAIEMYTFAVKYEIPRLRRDAIDRLVWWHEVRHSEVEIRTGYIGIATLVRVYENTCVDDPIHELLSEGYLEFGSRDVETCMALPKRLLAAVLKKTNDGFLSEPWQPCLYHGHANQAARDACVVRVQMKRGLDDDDSEDDY